MLACGASWGNLPVPPEPPPRVRSADERYALGSASDPSEATGRAEGVEAQALKPKPTALVVDWDGTVTERDLLEQVVLEFGDPEIYARTEADLGRTLTHDDVLEIEVGTVRAPLGEVVDFVVSEARLRPGFRELAAATRPLVVSAGFHELIEPVLAREGIDVDVCANRVDARPDGWRVIFRETARCESCGEACKRLALPHRRVVFVGDGYSDRCAALAADRVFATDGLARYLDSVGAEYEPFADFHDVAAAFAE